MFRDDTQRAKAIQLMLSNLVNAEVRGLWTERGPTELAFSIQDRGGGPYSTGENLMLRVAWDFWNGSGHADFGDVVGRLDPHNLRAALSLGLALAGGGAAVDAWIRSFSEPFTEGAAEP